MDMMTGPMMGTIMFSGGLLFLLVAAVMALSVVALVKYLRSSR
ncbi:MAG: hypothetical protein P1U83_16500 [Roseovarius sp.]|nr:hypothetical protein [Roseovarius sp.]